MLFSTTVPIEHETDRGQSMRQSKGGSLFDPRRDGSKSAKAIVIEDIFPGEFRPGETGLLRGSGFGDFEPESCQILIGSEKCDILNWRPDLIGFRVPVTLVPGEYDLSVYPGHREAIGKVGIELALLSQERRLAVETGVCRLLLVTRFEHDGPDGFARTGVLDQIRLYLGQDSRLKNQLICAGWPAPIAGEEDSDKAREVGVSQGADLVLHGRLDENGKFHPCLTVIDDKREASLSLTEFLTESLCAPKLLEQDCYRFSPVSINQPGPLTHFIAGWFLNRVGCLEEARALFLTMLYERNATVHDPAIFRFMAGVSGYRTAPIVKSSSRKGLATEIINHFEQAVRSYEKRGRHLDQARACLNLAAAYATLSTTSRTFLVREMEWARKALSLLIPMDNPRETLMGYVYLVSALARLAERHEGNERENYLDDALRLLLECGTQIEHHGSQTEKAILDFTEAVILGKRYRGGRDRNLARALLLLDSAITFFASLSGLTPRYVINARAEQAVCFLNLASGNREFHLQKAVAIFEACLNHPKSSVPLRAKYMRLKTLAEELLFQLERPGGDKTRPLLSPGETTRRFEQRIADLRGRDVEQAVDEAWTWLRWASHKSSISLQAACAHRALGLMKTQQKQHERALYHFYNAMVIAAGILQPGSPQYRFVHDLRLCFEMSEATMGNRSKKLMEKAVQGALLFARKCFQDGSKQDVANPLAAIDAYTEALSWFPDFHEAMVHRAIARYRSGDELGALRDIESALLRNPSDETAIFLRQKILKPELVQGSDTAETRADMKEVSLAR